MQLFRMQYLPNEVSLADYYDLKDGLVYNNNTSFQSEGSKAMQIIL